tara:strand:+ start:968 stop:1504 length:537 start_codon:yes stop_codon:yes gene_type:complete
MKNYKKASVPRGKRIAVAYDKKRDAVIVVDSSIPDLNGTRQPIQEIPDGDKFLWECRFCGATTKVGRKVCSLCNKDISLAIKAMDKIDEYKQHVQNCECCSCEPDIIIKKDVIEVEYDECDCICSHEPLIPSVRDGRWKPAQRWDYVADEKNNVCSVCFIVLPLSQGNRRKCDSCRKS